MRERGILHKLRWVLLAAILTTVGVLASAEPDGNSRLLSIQKLPENIDECMTWDKPVEADAARMTSSREKDLFTALQQDPSDASPTLVAEAQSDQKDADAGKAQSKEDEPSPDMKPPQYERQEREAGERSAPGLRLRGPQRKDWRSIFAGQ